MNNLTKEYIEKFIPKLLELKDEITQTNATELIEDSGSKNIIVIGAGYGGLTAALRLERLLKKKGSFNVHLIDKNPYHTIKTQLHEAAVRKAEVSIPIYKILKNRNIQFHLGEVKNIDVQNKTVQIDDKLLPFLFLVIAIGSKVNYYNIPGMAEHSFALQTLHDADKIYEHISNICASASSENNDMVRQESLRFVVGGGGLSGVEFAGELADHISKCLTNFNIDHKYAEIIIIEGADRLVPFMQESFSLRIGKKLIEKGIKILTGSKIERRTKNEIFLSDGSVIRSKNFIWTGGIRISDLIKRG